MYSVSLSNDSCIFDSEEGFETVQEVLDWSKDRSGKYLIQIQNDDSTSQYPFLSISAHDVGNFTMFSIYNGLFWQYVSEKQIAGMI